ncbi:MAG TPA: TIGR03013 family XrtA/PEP-CTERM system glycosyltransferase [Acetobacteraceae bacterium]|jgi:sugar transferase (PEP-CTERM system associated)|nr:TIGR03013 family XrtA/PEP-CTERM system glycosyltransferase [Acetobacteraceae bacterium]HTB44530.1 TIGR03013 family XrtA/PEP-CTERM system glycosyltransferase [Acetobacteraceae bacterium]
MTRILAQYVSLETAALGVIELILSFLIVEAFLNIVPGGLAALRPMASGLDANLTILAIIFAVVTAGIATTIGLYRPEVCLERRHVVVTAAVAGLVAFPILLLVSGSFHIDLTRWVIFWLALVLLVWQAGILATHLAFSAVVRRDGMVRRVLILGSERRTVRLADMLRSRRVRLFEPVVASAVPALSPDHLRQQRIWGIIVADQGEAEPAAATLLDSKLRGARVLSVTTFYERHLGRIDLDSVDSHWLLCADGFTQGLLTKVLKRFLDVVVSLSLLVLTLPVMLVTALLIKLDSPGPVLYRQQRLGLHGKVFTLCKFRSMRVDAEAGGKPRWAQHRDPRVTRVGRFIRPMRIDELPQLINVLLGEMSMIGPRPERPHFVEQLSRVIPLYRQRAYVKPGITGWAQVNYPYGASVEDAREKLAYDLYYVKNRSLLLDVLILFATVRVILFREGAR